MEKNYNIKSKVNMIFGLLNGVISTAQTLWFIPYVKSYLGTDAYGYIAVINGLINTLTIISFAIGAMSARFIVVELNRKNYDEANKFFNSDLAALLGLSVITCLIGLIICFNLRYVMNITDNFVTQVEVLFCMTLFSFLIQLIETPFSASIYYTNSVYISYIFFISDYVARILLTIYLFNSGVVVLWAAALASDIVFFISLVFYIIYRSKVMPTITISFSRISKIHFKKMFGSGIWFSISSAGNTMLTSLNSYFANILCGVFITGIYSAILQFSIIENVILSVLVNTSVAQMFQLYSYEKYKSLFEFIIKIMSIVGIFVSIISGGIIIFGNDFMRLWMGKQFTHYNLMIVLTCIYLPFTLPSQVINQYFSTADKVKLPAIYTIFFVILNAGLAVVFVKGFNLYIYGIIWASIVTQLTRDILFYPFYFSRISPVFNKKILLPYIISVIDLAIVIILCLSVRYLIGNGRIELFIIGVTLGGGLSVIASYIVWVLLKKRYSFLS
ncbi:MATE family efflux transporter [Limosilactobacillus reuteri]|uniref:hypothetical protein n=1 Tax=Limosilactobacillus reuteri TaxID=1598 RepID=UPI001E3D0186|nr:hypothetical protein [Limosilactobacillus reuteri]MCC4410163.1 hypothetical protein [Limosilactobacillus reuteri]